MLRQQTAQKLTVCTSVLRSWPCSSKMKRRLMLRALLRCWLCSTSWAMLRLLWLSTVHSHWGAAAANEQL